MPVSISDLDIKVKAEKPEGAHTVTKADFEILTSNLSEKPPDRVLERDVIVLLLDSLVF